jgi:hypothetical protein
MTASAVHRWRIAVYAEGRDTVTETGSYDNVKIWTWQDRRKSLGTEQNPEDSSNIVFSEKVLSAK